MSKHTLARASIAAMVTTVVASILGFAQGPGGAGRGTLKYNPATEVTLQGTVQELKKFTGTRGVIGTDVVLKTDQGTLDVRLGPSSFLAQNQFAVAQGDQIQVIGSKVQINGADLLLTREIKKGEQTLTLRNAQGIPVWSRRARR